MNLFRELLKLMRHSHVHAHAEPVAEGHTPEKSPSVEDRPLLTDDPEYIKSRHATQRRVTELNIAAILLKQEIDARAGRFDDHPAV